MSKKCIITDLDDPLRYEFSPSNRSVRRFVDKPGVPFPILPRPCLPGDQPETTGYVRLEINDLYRVEGQPREIPSAEFAVFTSVGLPIPTHKAFVHHATVQFLALPHEILHPLEAATLLEKFHGNPEFIKMLREDRMDLLYLDPSDRLDKEVDSRGRVHQRRYVHHASLYDLVRAERIVADQQHGHCTLALDNRLNNEESHGVGRLWRNTKTGEKETTHLIVWRMPEENYGKDLPPPDADNWIYPGLSMFGTKHRGLMIMLDIGLFDLINLRYLQACAFVMPAYDAHFGKS